jgi:uncharacterized protein (DUF2267 family)
VIKQLYRTSKKRKRYTMNEKVNFEKYCNEMKSWLTDIAGLMHVPERTDWAFNALRAVLHTLRDRSPLEEVFHLSAQLPVLVRGIYLEAYRPTGKPEKMNLDTFLKQIKKKMGAGVEVPPAEALRAVLTVLYEKISPGEMDDIRGAMPKDIQKLWDGLTSSVKKKEEEF